MKKTLLTLAVASALSMSAQAEQFWADNSVSLLNGSSYEFTDETLTTMTLEHVSGHSWGGLFYFVDRHNGGGFTETYGEFSPTFTLSKMDGVISSVQLAYTYEFGQNAFGGFDNDLVGVGANIKVPGFDFFSATIFRALNDGADTDDNQLTLAYGASFGDITIDGFMDYAFGSENDGVEDSMNLTPQITYNVGPMLGLKNKVKVGVEYSLWTNQFGIDGQDQSAVSLLLKAHL
jgi:nucleoside-specific outer membrane channel protein Tsx